MSPDVNPAHWLKQQIKLTEDEQYTTLTIPSTEDGSGYTIDKLYEDQKDIVAVVLDTLRDFLHTNELSNFKPLRVVINGQGGSGKSVVINTIVTLLREMFQFNDVIKVLAPTGVAAYNVNGETFHHFFNMGVTKGEYKANTLSKTARIKLIKKLSLALALVIDERSLVPSKVLGTAEALTSETIHEGGHFPDDSWGGLPILILVGDDYQLPGIGEGPLTALFSRYGSKMTYNGRKALLECADYVLQLGGSKRVRNSESETKALVDRLRIGTNIEERDVDKLLSLHLDAMRAKHGDAIVQDIEDRAMFLFYRNDKRNRHNLQQLCRRTSVSNPVAIIRSQSHGNTKGKGNNRHFDTDLPSTSLLCIDCKVAIHSRNLKPDWGLHNGGCGIVREIIFAVNKNPNDGDLPEYVIVEFPLYCGPPWDADNPKLVPIAPEEFTCKGGCCTRHFLPLTVAYARTIHKFQGLTAGPVDAGKVPNMFDVLVVDPDEKQCEGSALGLLYTAVSRATTLGNDDGIGSAIYFTGPAFKATRIRNLTYSATTNKEFEMARKRQHWVTHIQNQTVRSLPRLHFALENKQDLLQWGQSARYSYDMLYDRVFKYNMR